MSTDHKAIRENWTMNSKTVVSVTCPCPRWQTAGVQAGTGQCQHAMLRHTDRLLPCTQCLLVSEPTIVNVHTYKAQSECNRITYRLCAGSGFMEQTQSSGNTLPMLFEENGSIRHFRHKSASQKIHSINHVKQRRVANLEKPKTERLVLKIKRNSKHFFCNILGNMGKDYFSYFGILYLFNRFHKTAKINVSMTIFMLQNSSQYLVLCFLSDFKHLSFLGGATISHCLHQRKEYLMHNSSFT